MWRSNIRQIFNRIFCPACQDYFRSGEDIDIKPTDLYWTCPGCDTRWVIEMIFQKHEDFMAKIPRGRKVTNCAKN